MVGGFVFGAGMGGINRAATKWDLDTQQRLKPRIGYRFRKKWEVQIWADMDRGDPGTSKKQRVAVPWTDTS
ncbi:hypothetical protein AL073_12670 [Loktanella sp. 1ANDIMAR09]|nr:hypothetical protein AL073_12670 [Loktanella sp. 1ANDIMAR09]